MQRKRQEGYLRFRRAFLTHLHAELRGHLVSVAVRSGGEVVAAALFLRFGDYLDYFLAASAPEALALHPNHLLLHRVAARAASQGIQLFHLGGGHPSLQFFKHGFANGSCAYYLGKHIHDRVAYEQLAKDHWVRCGRAWETDSAFFPAYRAEF